MTNNAPSETLVNLAKSALALTEQTSWSRLTLSDLCADADVNLTTCARENITKADVAGQLDHLLDEAMLGATSKVDRSQGVRDRLFDALMSRFDAMEENRAAWLSILEGEASDALARIARQARRARSAAWALEASGVTASDMRGAGRVIGLARIIRLADAAWLGDGPDLAKTMACLDQELRKGQAWVERVQGISDRFSAFGFGKRNPTPPQDVAAD